MIAIHQADIERFQALIEERLGLSCSDWQAERLPGLLRERASKARCDTAQSYLTQLASTDLLRRELGDLAEQLTVGETYFFRESRQLDALLHVALPELAKRRSPGAPLRILSAGCSSGEEAYTLAIALEEHFRSSSGAARPAISILGIDMNPAVIKKARQARYSAWSLRATPKRLRERWFTPVGADYRLHEEIRSMATFEERNLLGADPSFWQPQSFEIIFCRNVTIYFSTQATRAVVQQLERSLVPCGFLFLGHSETLRGISDEFDLMHTHETFYYRRKGPPAYKRSLPPPVGASSRPPYNAQLEHWIGESWFDAIQRSTARIDAYTRRHSQTEAATLTPEQPGRAEQLDARPQLAMAMELFKAEHFAEAMALLKTLPAASLGDPDVELLTAVIYSNQGQFEGAEKICLRALGSGEHAAAAHYLLGLCREHEGDRARAVEHHRSAVRLDPSFAMPHLHLGILARRAGDTDTARAEMKLAAELVGRERPDRIVLFGGGFHRNALLELCRAELSACGKGV